MGKIIAFGKYFEHSFGIFVDIKKKKKKSLQWINLFIKTEYI